VTIKRFDIFGRKIRTIVRYPSAFNLKSFMDGAIDQHVATKTVGDEVYDLYGIVVHAGGSTNSGHYYSYCKNMITDRWYECNDDHIGNLSNES
jgi:ubiquitin carboxyl-terminal hydrolase 36/42